MLKMEDCHGFDHKYLLFQLGSSGSPYQTMRDEDGRAAHSFTMEFNNPKADSSNSFETAVIADNDADGKVTVLGYRLLREDGDDNCKGISFSLAS